MNTVASITDPEILELLADDKRLLAFADFIVSVAQGADSASQPAQRGRRRPPLVRLQKIAPWSRFRAARPFSRRFVVATAVAVGFLAVLVPIALAFRSQIVDLISGEPAPPSVAETFSAWNRLAKGGEVEGHPFGPFNQAIADKAVGVLRLRTPDGPISLYAAPKIGGGKCFMLRIEVNAAPPDPGFRTIGTCDGSQGPRSDYSNPDAIVPWAASFGEMPDAAFVLVRVFDAAGVEVRFSDGSTMPLQIVDGFALAAIPPNSIPPGTRPPVTVIATNADGRVIATDPLKHMSSVG
jgi:hypothetical protein